MLFQIKKQSSGTDIIPVEDQGVISVGRTYVDESGKEGNRDTWEIHVHSLEHLINIHTQVGVPLTIQETDGGFGDQAPALTIVIEDD